MSINIINNLLTKILIFTKIFTPRIIGKNLADIFFVNYNFYKIFIRITYQIFIRFIFFISDIILIDILCFNNTIINYKNSLLSIAYNQSIILILFVITNIINNIYKKYKNNISWNYDLMKLLFFIMEINFIFKKSKNFKLIEDIIQYSCNDIINRMLNNLILQFIINILYKI